jgi:hypothetical protein
MLQGFYRCATYDHNMEDSTRLALAVQRVDLNYTIDGIRRYGRRALLLQLA